MRIALHIFMKDARRLRIEIAVTVAPLAYLADLDRQRMDTFRACPRPGLICSSRWRGRFCSQGCFTRSRSWAIGSSGSRVRIRAPRS